MVRGRGGGLWRFYRSHIERGTDPFLARFMCLEYTHARLGLAARLGDGVQEALGRAPISFRDFAARERSAWLGSPSASRSPGGEVRLSASS